MSKYQIRLISKKGKNVVWIEILLLKRRGEMMREECFGWYEKNENYEKVIKGENKRIMKENENSLKSYWIWQFYSRGKIHLKQHQISSYLFSLISTTKQKKQQNKKVETFIHKT